MADPTDHGNDTVNGTGLWTTQRAGLVDDESKNTAILVIVSILCTGVSLVGIPANILNIVIFKKLGIKDNVTLCFLALACSDLASLVFLVWLGIAVNPKVATDPQLPFSSEEIVLLTASLPRSFFSRVSSCITAYVSIERCFCVTKPLEVKRIFTRKRTLIFIASIICALSLFAIPVYYSSRFVWKSDPLTNRTYLGVYHIPDRYKIISFSIIVDTLLSITNLVVVAICATILVRFLRKRKQWLARDTDCSKVELLSAKDRKAATTVTFLAAMFIACYSITIVNQLLMGAWKEYNRGGRYVNIYYIFVSLGYFTECICATANIFVYLKTNQKFRDIFKSTLCPCLGIHVLWTPSSTSVETSNL